MAEATPEQRQFLADITALVTKATAVRFDDVKLMADRQRIARDEVALLKAYNRAQKDVSQTAEGTTHHLKALNRQYQLADTLFEKATDGFSSSTKMQTILVNTINANLEKTGGAFETARLKSLEDVNAFREIHKSLGNILSANISDQSEFNEAYAQFAKLNVELTEQGITTFTDFFARITEQVNGAKTLTEKQAVLAKVTGKTTEAIKRAGEELTRPLTKLVDDMERGIKSFARGLFSFEAAAAKASAAIIMFYNDVQAMGKVGTVGSLTDLYTSAGMMGVKPNELIEAQASNRQLIMNIGSAAKWSSQTKTLQRDYANYLGDNLDALKLTTSQLDSFARSGVSAAASFELVGATSDTFKYLNKTMGVTSEQFMSLQHGLLETDEIRWSLMGASEAERKAIIQGTIARSKEWAQLGMTTEQMAKAEQALRGLAGMDPKQRFKKAAQLQMMAGIYGVGGGSELAEITRKGARATPEELARSREILEQINTQMAAGARGTYGQEFLSTRLQELAGMPQLLGPGSAITTELNTGVKFEKSTADNTKRAAETLTAIASNVQRIMVTATMNAAALAAIAGVVTIGAIARGGLGGLSGGLGKIKGRAGGAGGAGTGMWGKLKGVKPSLPGLALTAASFMTPQESTAGRLLGSHAATGAGLGMMLGSVVPGLGTAAGGGVGFLAGGALDLYDYLSSPSQPGVKTDATDVRANLQQTAEHFNILAGKTDETNQLLKTIVEVGREQTNVLKTNKDDNIRLFDRGMRMGKMDTGSSNNALQLQAAKG